MLNIFFHQAGDWQVIENSDPLLQLKRIRQQQQAEIRKLRREGSIARSAYYTTEDEDSSEEGHHSNTDCKDSSVFNSTDQVDGTLLQQRSVTSLVMCPSKAKDDINRSPNRIERGPLENLSGTNDDAVELKQDSTQEDKEKTLSAEQTDDSDILPRTTKWVDDTGDIEEDVSEDDDEISSTANLSCLTQVVVGLLKMLEEVMRCASDTTAHTLLAEALYMDQTLIMANHPQPVIRQAVLKVKQVVTREENISKRKFVTVQYREELNIQSGIKNRIVQN